MLVFAMTAPPGRSGGQDGILEEQIAKIALGDKSALALLYRETYTAVYGFALSILKNKQDAEDVLQDAYLQIWKAAGTYTPAGKPLAWIFTITRNQALMRLREQSRTVAVDPEDWQSRFSQPNTANPEDKILLSSLLGQLSDQERQIVMLHAMTGLRHRQIAELLHLKLPTVLSKYNRAMKKLRGALKEADRYDK